MKEEILKHLDKLSKDQLIMLKLTIPSEDNLFAEIIEHPQVMRVVALSGGYSREYAVEALKRNPGLIASFSRAFVEGTSVGQTESQFNTTLRNSIEEIYEGSII